MTMLCNCSCFFQGFPWAVMANGNYWNGWKTFDELANWFIKNEFNTVLIDELEERAFMIQTYYPDTHKETTYESYYRNCQCGLSGCVCEGLNCQCSEVVVYV